MNWCRFTTKNTFINSCERIMSISIPPATIDGCFDLMQNWNAEAKKEMIIRLLNSLEPKRDSDFSACFGAWEDDRDADEIIKEIYENRRDRSHLEAF